MDKLRRYLGEATLCRMRAAEVVDPNLQKLYLQQAETLDQLAKSCEWLVLWQQAESKR